MTGPPHSLLARFLSLCERSVPLWLILATGSLAALVSGSAFLEAPLPGGLPVGNLLAALTCSALAATAVGLSRPGTVVRHFSVVSLVTALAWLPVSIGLAGNAALNFSGVRGQAWLWLSLATAVLVVLALAGATIDRVLARRLRKRTGSERQSRGSS